MTGGDPLHSTSDPDTFWTTTNVGEALPGVMTPLGWSLFGTAGEHGLREAFYRTGAYTRAERRVSPRIEERTLRIFHGRPAMDVAAVCKVGDRLPGTSGAKIAANVLGSVPPDLVHHPTRRQYGAVAVRFPSATAKMLALSRRDAARTAMWWQRQVTQVAGHDETAARAAFQLAADRFDRHVVDQTTMLFTVVQPMYEALGLLVTRAGVGDVGTLTGGYGGVPENAVVAALWDAAHGHVDLSDVVRRFGFHGPMEGEISGRVWREDDSPLRRIMLDYAGVAIGADPRSREAARRAERVAHERLLLAAVPRGTRPAARAVLALAARGIPKRGLLKVAFLQALDVCRANARRMGELVAVRGGLGDPEDIFYLTVDEIRAGIPDDAKELVAERRRLRTEHAAVRIPAAWRGIPAAVPDEPMLAHRDRVVSGIGVSPGVVEGLVRVVDDPTFAEVEPGEVLVARTTDPSWSSIMFVSAALVVDIGGALSHAAVVARELGVPCVVNTGSGSRLLRTGDRVRVDGAAGTVEILDS